jgi:LDH2 family malate/lactate/ureidoglycolate dehydrogenase
MDASDAIRVNSLVLFDFSISVLMTLGVENRDAGIWAESMMDASLRGIDSHGVLVLPIYASILEAGGIKPRASLEILSDEGATLLLDGGDGIGAVIATQAMELAMERAQRFGVAFVGVRNSSHFGTAGYYAMKALDKDMIGMALTNAGPQLSAWGGKSKVVGSNAMGVAVPAGEEFPVIFDIAMGASAAAKIFLAAERGERIPVDWMRDKTGQPTDDPKAFFEGGVLQPFGQHKGYGLGLVVDALTGVLSGGLFSTGVGQFAARPSEPVGVCQSFGALDIKRFIPVSQFKERMDEMIRNVKESEPLEEVGRVYLPGEQGLLTREDRLKNGIPLHNKLIGDLRALAKRLSIESPC